MLQRDLCKHKNPPTRHQAQPFAAALRRSLRAAQRCQQRRGWVARTCFRNGRQPPPGKRRGEAAAATLAWERNSEQSENEELRVRLQQRQEASLLLKHDVRGKAGSRRAVQAGRGRCWGLQHKNQTRPGARRPGRRGGGCRGWQLPPPSTLRAGAKGGLEHACACSMGGGTEHACARSQFGPRSRETSGPGTWPVPVSAQTSCQWTLPPV